MTEEPKSKIPTKFLFKNSTETESPGKARERLRHPQIFEFHNQNEEWAVAIVRGTRYIQRSVGAPPKVFEREEAQEPGQKW